MTFYLGYFGFCANHVSDEPTLNFIPSRLVDSFPQTFHFTNCYHPLHFLGPDPCLPAWLVVEWWCEDCADDGFLGKKTIHLRNLHIITLLPKFLAFIGIEGWDSIGPSRYVMLFVFWQQVTTLLSNCPSWSATTLSKYWNSFICWRGELLIVMLMDLGDQLIIMVSVLAILMDMHHILLASCMESVSVVL